MDPLLLAEVSQLGVGLTEAPSGRMRKRDIVRYYGRRMIRKAGMELRHLRRRPKERVLNAAKRFQSYNRVCLLKVIRILPLDFSKGQTSPSGSSTRSPQLSSLRLILLRYV